MKIIIKFFFKSMIDIFSQTEQVKHTTQKIFDIVCRVAIRLDMISLITYNSVTYVNVHLINLPTHPHTHTHTHTLQLTLLVRRDLFGEHGA